MTTDLLWKVLLVLGILALVVFLVPHISVHIH